VANYPEVVYWLTLINESQLKLNLVKPLIQRWCVNEKRHLADLFELSALEMSALFGLADADAERIIRSNQKLAGQARVLGQWQSQGLDVVILTDPRYPRRLIHTLSPVRQPLLLWLQGAAGLLNQPGVTLLGRKEANETTGDFIQELIATLEREEIGLVSGYERGLDRAAFDLMLATKQGFTLAVLPMGLSAFLKTTSRLNSAVEAGRTLLVSPFSPDTPFQEKLAEARNVLIDHLTLALLIPDSDEDSQVRATAALERGLPIFVKADTPANRALIELGALLLTDSGEVVDWVQQAVIDAAFLEEDEEEETPVEDISAVAAPLTTTVPEAPLLDSSEDYSLRFDEVAPLDRDEALEVLSLGGEIPEVLRRRLQKQEDEEE
jgi:predicted Rossmann fold nucleotide-binding protein DprA/Smf involved in DNA uptake